MLAVRDGPIDGVKNRRVAFDAKLGNLDDRRQLLERNSLSVALRRNRRGGRSRSPKFHWLFFTRCLRISAEESVLREKSFHRASAFGGPFDLKEVGRAGDEFVVDVAPLRRGLCRSTPALRLSSCGSAQISLTATGMRAIPVQVVGVAITPKDMRLDIRAGTRAPILPLSRRGAASRAPSVRMLPAAIRRRYLANCARQIHRILVARRATFRARGNRILAGQLMFTQRMTVGRIKRRVEEHQRIPSRAHPLSMHGGADRRERMENAGGALRAEFRLHQSKNVFEITNESQANYDFRGDE